MENPRKVFRRLKIKYSPLFEATKNFYSDLSLEGKSDKGHGFDHDLFVAQIGYLISGDRRIRECAWVAGLLHSIDHHYRASVAEKVVKYCFSLVSRLFTEEEAAMILEAVALHSQLPSGRDNPVKVALQDADMLANLGPLVFFRGAQQRPNIPACIMETMGRRNPKSSFRNPASCYDALFFNLEWKKMIRSPKAKRMARPYFKFIRKFMALALLQQKEVGLFPYP